ncbi:serine/threonine-protein kinase 31 isoform X1 [Sarcophilus harrisii]|uniref:serine/threonine-protein kinase 31 isoform X1 n=2 Tax=Sarcophilus harrisii TaxID=9305 RepID=UPI001301FDDE|nr:serine/threonine-protein kinase 31 isoform X1 [Sarcophilus harrisii]
MKALLPAPACRPARPAGTPEAASRRAGRAPRHVPFPLSAPDGRTAARRRRGRRLENWLCWPRASFSGAVNMDEDVTYNKVEDVVGSHVEDAVTFWAQSINRNRDIVKIGCALAEVCPQSSSVFGNPDLNKIYAGLFSEDKCWYRCKVQKVISDEKCLVRYIDYGNTEILNRSEIVEIPLNLQFPDVAKKYRLWGLQIPSGQEVTQFDQGRSFLGSLIFEKEIKMRHKATYQDGTIVAQAEYGNVDIGEEVAKKGYAEKCKLPSSNNVPEEKKTDPGQLGLGNLKSPIPLWGHRPNPSAFTRPKGRFNGRMVPDLKTKTLVTFPKERLAVGDFNLGSNVSLEKIKQDQKLIEENEKLKAEKEALLESYRELELKVEQTSLELQRAKVTSMELTKHLENTLHTHVGTRMKSLAAKVEILKEVRRANINVRCGDDLSDAVKVVAEGHLVTPSSLDDLEKIWEEYNLAQEKIQICQNVNEGDILIAKRNEVRQKLYTAVEVFIVEVDELSLNKRLKTLQELSASLEAVYGQTREVTNAEEILHKFYEWKHGKREEFNRVRTETDTSLQLLAEWFSSTIKFFDLNDEESLSSEEVIGNVDEILEKIESDVCKELEISLVEQGDTDKEIILNTYNEVLQKIRSEERLITIVQAKYKASIEFKKQIMEWLNKSPNVDHLLSIKKTLKGLKAQLRWKLVEKNNLEEADDCNEPEIEKIKEEITQLRHRVFEKIYHEQEEYEKLTSLVQKWFPELPLLHPEAGILKYMNSGGILTVSLERDLLDAEPMKELSSKRPLVCSEVDGQKVLLKGYSVDMDTEATVIQRAARYHKAWRESKEESGLLPLMFLFLCKSDPLAYLMVPYYPRASLSAVQASTPLSAEEALKVMKGVAHGLHTLHKANIIHGSLHHNNIFVLNRERGIVGDFDFTKSVSQRTAMNSMVLGGLNLMSPELKVGQPASPSSDLYAYGCLLLWLCVQNQEFEINEDGIPEVDGLHLDDDVKTLLSSLIYCRNSMTAEQVLNAECFLLPKITLITYPEKDSECEEKEELEEENLDMYDEKARNSEDNFDQ